MPARLALEEFIDGQLDRRVEEVLALEEELVSLGEERAHLMDLVARASAAQ